jgi:PAS domain-containing protein
VILGESERQVVEKFVPEEERLTQELQRREAYLAEAQRLSHTGSFGWRVSTGEIIWSEETFRIFGYEPATKPTVDLVLQRVHPEDAALVKQTIERVSQEAKDFDVEYRLLMPDGSVKYVHVVAHASSDDGHHLGKESGREDPAKRKGASQDYRNNSGLHLDR